MRKAIIAIAASSMLCGCGDSYEVRKDKFVTTCTANGFAINQCQFLFAMQEKADTDSSTAAALSGMAIGIGAANGARR